LSGSGKSWLFSDAAGGVIEHDPGPHPPRSNRSESPLSKGVGGASHRRASSARAVRLYHRKAPLERGAGGGSPRGSATIEAQKEVMNLKLPPAPSCEGEFSALARWWRLHSLGGEARHPPTPLGKGGFGREVGIRERSPLQARSRGRPEQQSTSFPSESPLSKGVGGASHPAGRVQSPPIAPTGKPPLARGGWGGSRFITSRKVTASLCEVAPGRGGLSPPPSLPLEGGGVFS